MFPSMFSQAAKALKHHHKTTNHWLWPRMGCWQPPCSSRTVLDYRLNLFAIDVKEQLVCNIEVFMDHLSAWLSISELKEDQLVFTDPHSELFMSLFWFTFIMSCASVVLYSSINISCTYKHVSCLLSPCWNDQSAFEWDASRNWLIWLWASKHYVCESRTTWSGEKLFFSELLINLIIELKRLINISSIWD